MVEETPRLVIRKAEPHDAASIHQAFVTAIRAIGPQYYTDEQKQAWEEAVTPESWSTRMLELNFFVAEIDEEVVGFVSWYGCELVHIYVAADAGGHGIGTALMQYAIANMKYGDLTLTASLNAAEFYEGFGFTREEMLAKERGGVPIPCIRMKRRSV